MSALARAICFLTEPFRFLKTAFKPLKVCFRFLKTIFKPSKMPYRFLKTVFKPLKVCFRFLKTIFGKKTRRRRIKKPGGRAGERLESVSLAALSRDYIYKR